MRKTTSFTGVVSYLNIWDGKVVVPGTLYIISAPSGAGKSRLIRELVDKSTQNHIRVSTSHTTRAKRPGEIDWQHYYFVTPQTFAEMSERGEFIEQAQVFGNSYGTSRREIETNLAKGVDLFLVIDWQGARQIRQKVDMVCTIFIVPPSLEELERRLYMRGQDSTEVIRQRLVQATEEISHYREYDYLVVNDDFAKALSELKAIIIANRLLLRQQCIRHSELLDKLLAR